MELVSIYRSADKSLARPTSQCILFDGENISFDASLVIYINSTNIPPIMIINRIYETQKLLSLQLVSFLVRLRTYQHPCTYCKFCCCVYYICPTNAQSMLTKRTVHTSTFVGVVLYNNQSMRIQE